MSNKKENEDGLAMFTQLLPEKTRKSIEAQWSEYRALPKDIYGPGRYEINFFEKDGVDDTVIFMSISYDHTTGKWWTENSITDDVKFDTFEACWEHYVSIEREISGNDFNIVALAL